MEDAPTPSTTTTHIILDGPPHKGPFPVFYVDGQRIDSAAVVQLNPNDLESVSVLKDFDARLLGTEEGRRGVILVVTKAGQHTRAVRAFYRRLERLGRR